MNILIVEDSRATRKLLGALVNSGPEKYQVFEVGSGEEALEVLGHDNAPGIEIFLVDLHLPGIDGATLARELRNRFSSGTSYYPYIMMVTSDELDATINRCLDAGANDYVTKPVNLKVLQIRLRVARVLCEIGKAAKASDYLRALALGALNTAVIPMAICDAAPSPAPLPVAFANRAMAEMLGAGQDELSGRSLPELQAWTRPFTARALSATTAGHCFTEAIESTAPQSSRVNLFCSLVPINVRSGAPSHVLVIQAAAP